MLTTLTHASVSAQQKLSSRGVTESAQRLLKWISFTEARTSVYKDLRSVPTLGGFVPVAPEGLQRLQGSRVTLSKGVARAPATKAKDNNRSDILVTYAESSLSKKFKRDCFRLKIRNGN